MSEKKEHKRTGAFPLSSPFVLQIRDIAYRPGQMREFERTLTVEEHYGEGIARVEAGSQMQLSVRAESVEDGIFVSGRARASIATECGRCLREFERKIEVDLAELFFYEPENEEEYRVFGDRLDLSGTLRDHIVLALPFQPLCRDDCGGLNIGESTGAAHASSSAHDVIVYSAESDTSQAETDEEELDARWQKLAHFLQNGENENAST